MVQKAKPKGKKAKGPDAKLVGAVVGVGLMVLALLVYGFSHLQPNDPRARPTKDTAKPDQDSALAQTLYGLSATKMDGESVSISSFRGKTLLMVNVASRWGSTQTVYEQLATWHKRYGDRLEILLFPSDEFRQELPSEQIPAFVQGHGLPTNGGGCTLMSKVDLNGPAAAPLFAYAKRLNRVDSIGWNFDGLFVFDGDGQAQGRYHRGDLPGADATLRRLLGAGFPS